MCTIAGIPDAIHITTATDLVPRVVRQAIAIDILRHHHHTGLIHTAENKVFHLLIGVAPNGEVALTRDIGNGVVEVEGDIPAPSAKGDDM